MGSPGHFSRYDDDDPDFEYHQHYYDQSSRESTIAASILILLIILILSYLVLHKLDLNLVPLRQFLWNWLVFFIPYRLLELLDDDASLDSLLNSPIAQPSSSVHALKSEKMRRVLGLDKGSGFMGTIAQTGQRRLSSLPSHNLKEGAPPGLGNWDNSCYQNSMLQGLASLDSILEYLAGPQEKSQWENGRRMPMATALRELIAQLRDPENSGKRIWTPATLKNMSSLQQQDAQEYLSKVLDVVDREVAIATRAANDVGSQISSDSDSDEVSNGSTVRLNTTRNPLDGSLAQRVGCTACGYSDGLSMIPFTCLMVPIGRDCVYDVAECLDEYTILETIQGIECGNCTLLKNQRLLTKIIERMSSSTETADRDKVEMFRLRLEAVTEALAYDDHDEKTLRDICKIPKKNRVSTVKSRQAVIARPPKSLAIHIIRSLVDGVTGEAMKNYAEVRFPKILDLGPWCLGSSGSGEDIKAEEWDLDPTQSLIAGSKRSSKLRGPIYELRAVVTHYGRHENGHYICYRKHPAAIQEEKEPQKDSWWRLSDDDVTKATEEEVLDQGGVVMLFYDRISDSTTTSLPRKSSIRGGEIRLHAADIPLPESPASSDIESASDVGDNEVPNIELPVAIPMSRDHSRASVDSADSHTDGNEQTYQGPAKPIMIKPFVQPHGYRKPEKDDPLGGKASLSSAGLVMV